MTLEIRNYTPFVPFAFEKQGKAGETYAVMIVKGTFDLHPEQVKIAADQQLPVLADHYYGEPETSSLVMEGDLVRYKPGADIYITGHAYRPREAAGNEWLAQIAVAQTQVRDSAQHKTGDVLTLRHTLHLHGPRFWEIGFLGGWRLSPAETVSAVALQYELAFGGQFERKVKVSAQHPNGVVVDAYAPNPVGIGYYQIDSMERGKRYPAPQIMRQSQTLNKLDDRPEPAGTTPISRWWPQRYQYAGTYDQRWQDTWQNKDGKPLEGIFPALPADFNDRFYNAASPGLVWPGWLQGDETLHLRGLFAQGAMQTRLMGLRLLGIAQGGSESGRTELLKLDTLHIDLDARQVILTWRLTIAQSLGVERVQIMFAHADEGYDVQPDGAHQRQSADTTA